MTGVCLWLRSTVESLHDSIPSGITERFHNRLIKMHSVQCNLQKMQKKFPDLLNINTVYNIKTDGSDIAWQWQNHCNSL